MFDIKQFRKDHDLYQAAFAKIIGQTQSGVSRMESENMDLTRNQLQKLKDKYGAEEINKYVKVITNRNDNEKESLSNAQLLEIVNKQNDTICRMLEMQNNTAQKLVSINERLIALLEK